MHGLDPANDLLENGQGIVAIGQRVGRVPVDAQPHLRRLLGYGQEVFGGEREVGVLPYTGPGVILKDERHTAAAGLLDSAGQPRDSPGHAIGKSHLWIALAGRDPHV